MATMNEPAKRAQNLSGYAREASDTLSETKDDLKEIAGRAGRNIRSLVEEGREEISEATERYTAAIRRKPVQASLIALGSGILLGMLLRR